MPSPTLASQPPTGSPTPAPEPALAQAGEPVEAGTWRFTVDDLQWHPALYYNDHARTAEGIFAVLFLTIQNQGSGAGSFSQLQWQLHDTAGHEYDEGVAVSHAAWQFGDKGTAYEDVDPGATAQIVMTFDVCEDSEGLTLFSANLGRTLVYIGDAPSR
jgi:hypothetical protein